MINHSFLAKNLDKYLKSLYWNYEKLHMIIYWKNCFTHWTFLFFLGLGADVIHLISSQFLLFCASTNPFNVCGPNSIYLAQNKTIIFVLSFNPTKAFSPPNIKYIISKRMNVIEPFGSSLYYIQKHCRACINNRSQSIKSNKVNRMHWGK